jgi:hypothetical protein
MNINLGKMVQKSSGVFGEHLENSRLRCRLAGAKIVTFAFWNACAKSAQKSVELKCWAD